LKITYKQNYDYDTLNWLLLATKSSNWRTNNDKIEIRKLKTDAKFFFNLCMRRGILLHLKVDYFLSNGYDWNIKGLFPLRHRQPWVIKFLYSLNFEVSQKCYAYFSCLSLKRVVDKILLVWECSHLDFLCAKPTPIIYIKLQRRVLGK